MTISGERTEQLDIFFRVTGVTSDFLSFIDVELIRFFHRALHLTPLLHKGLDVPSKVGLLLVHGSKFIQMSFLLPPMTLLGTSGSSTQDRWVQVRRFNHTATAAP